jgi:pimeloyl-ACP methyl ester carboxylesterase
VIAEATETFARMPKRDFTQVWGATTGFLDPDPAYRTPVPLLLIRGALDRTGNIRTAMPAWAAAEGVPERVIPDAGHLANLDAPDAVNDLLGEFVRSVRA